MKRTLEILITPLAIALVGSISTYFITKYQTESSNRLAQAQLKSSVTIASSQLESQEKRAEIEQRINALKIFSENFKLDDPKQRKLGLQILAAVDKNLANELASAVTEIETDEKTNREARKIIEETKKIIALIQVEGRLDDGAWSNLFMDIYIKGDVQTFLLHTGEIGAFSKTVTLRTSSMISEIDLINLRVEARSDTPYGLVWWDCMKFGSFALKYKLLGSEQQDSFATNPPTHLIPKFDPNKGAGCGAGSQPKQVTIYPMGE